MKSWCLANIIELWETAADRLSLFSCQVGVVGDLKTECCQWKTLLKIKLSDTLVHLFHIACIKLFLRL